MVTPSVPSPLPRTTFAFTHPLFQDVFEKILYDHPTSSTFCCPPPPIKFDRTPGQGSCGISGDTAPKGFLIGCQVSRKNIHQIKLEVIRM